MMKLILLTLIALAGLSSFVLADEEEIRRIELQFLCFDPHETFSKIYIKGEKEVQLNSRHPSDSLEVGTKSDQLPIFDKADTGESKSSFAVSLPAEGSRFLVVLEKKDNTYSSRVTSIQNFLPGQMLVFNDCGKSLGIKTHTGERILLASGESLVLIPHAYNIKDSTTFHEISETGEWKVMRYLNTVYSKSRKEFLFIHYDEERRLIKFKGASQFSKPSP